MALYENWFRKAYNERGQIKPAFWDKYMPKEQKIYEYLIGEKVNCLKGTVKELAEKFDMTPESFAGFIDGINDALDQKIEMEELTEDREVEIKFDYERLYKKMVEYKAKHLYSLPQWESIFTKEQLEVFYKEQKNSRTVHKEKKIGRNDPCPCGSGKKYKQCCGARR